MNHKKDYKNSIKLSLIWSCVYVPAMFGKDIMLGTPKAAAHVAVDLQC